MNNFTQNFYQKKGKGTVNRWLTTLCLTFVIWLGALGEVTAQTWLASAASGNYNSGDGLGYTVGGIGTFYRGASGGASTFSTDAVGCNGSTQTIQMTSSVAIFKATVNLNGIVLYGNSGTGSNRTLASIQTSLTLNGTYTAVTGSTASGNLSGGQTTNFCSPAPMTITFGSVIAAGTFIRIALSGNAYIAAIAFVSACAAPTLTYNLTGGTSICSGGSASLGLSGSQINVSYQLYNGAATVGSAVAGTGSAISFAAVSPTTNTTYSVKAKGTGGAYCTTETAAFASTAAVTMKSVSVAPVVSSPIIGGATFVSGTNVEADGTAIDVFVNGLSAGTTTVTGGAWSATVAAVTLGDFVTAKATATGKCLSLVSNSVTVSTSCTAPTFSTQPINNQSVCLNATAPTLGTVVADQSPSYQWYVVGTQTNTGGTTVSTGTGENTDTYTPASTTAGIYYYYCVATNGGCTTASNAVQFTVNAPTMTLGANPSVFTGDITANLTYSATTGTPTQYAIDWNPAAEAAGLVDVALTTLPASPIVLNNIPTTIATYNGTLTVRNAGGCVSVGYPISVIVTAPVSQATDYFRSKTAGGAWATAGTWESSADGIINWVTATAAPTASAKGIEIQANSTVTVGANLTTPLPTVNNTIQVNGTLAVDITFKLTLGGDMLVGSTGTLTLTGSTAASLITTGKVLTVLGTFTNGNSSTTAITTAAGELIFANATSAGKYEITVTGVTGVQVPVATWVNGTRYSTIAFKNSGGTALVPVWNDKTATLGDVEINSTSTILYRAFGNVSGSAFTMRNLTVTSAGTGGVQFFGGSNPYSLTLSGNYTQVADVVTLTFANSSTVFTVAGNFSVANGATFRSTGGTGTVTFNGTTPQTFNSAGTFSSGIDVSVASLASVSIGTGQNIPVKILKLGGTAQTSPATYGGTGSNADTIDTTYFAATTGILSVGPSISFTGALAAVDTTYGTASSTPATFSVSGTNVTAGILVTPPSGYEVSLTLGSGYAATVTVGAAGTIASTPVYVRLSATTAAGSYSGNIVLSSASATSRNVATVSSAVNPATNNWTGGTGNWNTAANWSLIRIPSSLNDNITISSGTPAMDVNYTLAIGRTLTISGTGTLTINPASVLTISGTANFGGQSVVLKSDATGTGTIGQVTGTLTGATNVTVERYIPAKRAWRALTAPVSTASSIFTNWQEGGNGNGTNGIEIWAPTAGTGLTTGGSSNSLLSYNSTGNSWTGIAATNGASSMMIGDKNKPFMAFVTGPYGSTNITNNLATETTLRATGTLISGTKSYASASGEYTFIGNPYASPLSFSAMLGDIENNAFSGNIWIWDAKATGDLSVGGYNLYDNANSRYTNTTNVTGSELTNTTLIQSGQAFFVKQSSGSSVDFKIKEAYKGTISSNAVFRQASVTETLRVGLYKQVNNEWIGKDGAMTVLFAEANANQLPNKMANGSENIAFTKNGLLFASEHHFPLVASDVLNVKVWNTTAGINYKLKINTEQFTTTNLDATLEDLFTNSRTPLTLNGTAVEYPFAVTTEAASTGNRFRIVFQNAVLGINNPKVTEISILPNPITGDAFQVNLGTLSTGTYSYSICNSLGQEVEKGSINNASQNTNYTVKFKNNTAAGMYIMKVTGTDNTVFTVKIIKK